MSLLLEPPARFAASLACAELPPGFGALIEGAGAAIPPKRALASFSFSVGARGAACSLGSGAVACTFSKMDDSCCCCCCCCCWDLLANAALAAAVTDETGREDAFWVEAKVAAAGSGVLLPMKPDLPHFFFASGTASDDGDKRSPASEEMGAAPSTIWFTSGASWCDDSIIVAEEEEKVVGTYGLGAS